MRIAILALCFGVLCASPVAATGPGAALPATMAQTRQAETQVRAAVNSFTSGALQNARTQARAATDAPGFDGLTEEFRHAAWYVLAAAASQIGEPAEAHDAWRHATAFSVASPLEWYGRLLSASAANDEADAAQVLTVIAQRYPEQLAQVGDDYVVRLFGSIIPTLPEAGHLRYELADALDHANWSTAEPGSGGAVWLRHVLDLMEHDRAADALRVAQRLTAPLDIAVVRTDRRYDAILSAAPARWEMTAAAERFLAAERAFAAAEPASLTRRNSVAETLVLLGRYDEALTALDDALAAALPADGSASRLTGTDRVNWAMDLRARVLDMLGRDAEALQQRARASRRPESGGMNVSQTLNEGILLWHARRSAEARGAIADVAARDVSPYGQSVLFMLRACIAVDLNDAAETAAALASLRPLEGVSRENLAEGLACAGLDDEAAGVLSRDLDDPNRRSRALLGFQTWRTPPNRPTQRGDLLLARLRGRPSLQALARRYGRVETMPIMGDTF